MRIVTLTRSGFIGPATFGFLSLEGATLFSLENREAQILVGEYLCDWTYSEKFKRHTYEVLEVPRIERQGFEMVEFPEKRTGIRFHPANYATELQGCISLGLGKGTDFLVRSRLAVQQFEESLNRQPFTLVIVDSISTRAVL